jgi:hypothetical protein
MQATILPHDIQPDTVAVIVKDACNLQLSEMNCFDQALGEGNHVGPPYIISFLQYAVESKRHFECTPEESVRSLSVSKRGYVQFVERFTVNKQVSQVIRVILCPYRGKFVLKLTKARDGS